MKRTQTFSSNMRASNHNPGAALMIEWFLVVLILALAIMAVLSLIDRRR